MSTDETCDDDAVSIYTYIRDIYDTPAASVHSYAAVGSASDGCMVEANNGVFVVNPQIASPSDE